MKTRIRIVATGRYLPPRTITNADLEKMVDTTSEWIETRTGIMNRHMAEGEETSDMAVKAAQNAFAKSGCDPRWIDLIVVASITGDQQTPSVANFVQAKLGMNDRMVSAFDVNAACTGFIYALDVASALLQTGRFRAALVIGVERLTKIVDYRDRNTCVLFGDGAGAAIVEPASPPFPATHFFTSSKGDFDDALSVRGGLIRMNGQKVYAFAVEAVEAAIRTILERAKMDVDDLEVLIPHQANVRIIQSVARSLDIPFHKFFMNIRDVGNTSAASIAIALDEYRDTHPEASGKRALLVGFGGGFTWGSVILTL